MPRPPLWNGVDPILKERLFGLTNGEGNHGEDVREYYFYLDSTRDLILFYEYFHGDNGAGIGASHQTGWAGLAAWLIKSIAILDPKEVVEEGFDAAGMKMIRGH